MSCQSGRPTFRLLDRRVGWTDGRFEQIRDHPVSFKWVGTDPAGVVAPVVTNLTAWDDPDGIQLEPTSGSSAQPVVDALTLLASLPPRRLALSCGPGSWLLLTPEGKVLLRDRCTDRWCRIWCAEYSPGGLTKAHALAATPERFAIAGAEGVQVCIASGEKQVAGISVKDPDCVAFFPGGDLLVASLSPESKIQLQRFDPTGHVFKGAAPSDILGPVRRLAVDVTKTIWLVTGKSLSSQQLYSGPWGGTLAPAAATTLAKSFPPTGLTGESEHGFCLQETDPEGVAKTKCFSWDGCPVSPTCVPPPPLPPLKTSGSITSGWLDSEIPRCRWHRVRVDADVPRGAGIEISYVTTDFDPSNAYDLQLTPTLTDVSRIPTTGKNLIIVANVNEVLHFRVFDGDGKRAVDGDEKSLTGKPRQIDDLRRQLHSLLPPAGLTGKDKDRLITAVASIVGYTALETKSWETPSPDDHQSGPPGALDVLINLPAGRYLQLSLTLTGDGTHTPVVRSVRIDFPRRTSLDWLPAVYRENPEAEDFTERFLANFDASIEDIDAAITRFPALLASSSVPSQVLPWLGSFLDVAFDPDWSDCRRRAILSALPLLYAQRGTLAGLIATIDTVFHIKPAIRELATERSWGALADSKNDKADALVQPDARVGAVRLFGKGRARFRLGHSALGAAPIRGYGNPDLDPIVAEAYRFEVQLPRGTSPIDQSRVTGLIESQKPAHTAMSVRFGGDGFVVGIWSSVGIDTAFTPLPQPVLGASGNIRLRRASVVAASPARGRLPLVVGLSSAVGVQTSLK